jgi:hypothetical protein
MRALKQRLGYGSAVGLALAISAAALADGRREERYTAKLISYAETPAISSAASGRFTLVIDETAQTMSYEVTYEGLEGAVQQSHIHFGQPGVTGGVSLFLCSNLGNGPAGTPSCPAAPGTVTGVLSAAQIVGPNSQGIAPASAGISPAEFAEIIRAIRSGVTYANVHSVKFPGGEIRGQLLRAGRGDRDD